MSCDMITDSHLHQVVDIHRMYDASLTAVFANHMEVCGEKDVAAGSKSRQKDPYDGICTSKHLSDFLLTNRYYFE